MEEERVWLDLAGVHQSRVAVRKEKEAAWFWQMILGSHLCVCIQAVFATASVGVVRKRKCTL